MAEYIEREAALKKLLQCADVYNPECSDITVAHAMRKISAIPAADVVARDCYDKILAENDDMRAIIDTYGGLENIQSAFVKLHEIETADVVPVRHAMWIFSGGDYPYCSGCGCESLSRVKRPYCQFCGALMDGKDGKKS